MNVKLACILFAIVLCNVCLFVFYLLPSLGATSHPLPHNRQPHLGGGTVEPSSTSSSSLEGDDEPTTVPPASRAIVGTNELRSQTLPTSRSFNYDGLYAETPSERGCRIQSLANLASHEHVLPSSIDWIKANVRIAVITGSFDGFFRVDLAQCTWLSHVPSDRYAVYTDKANTSDGRPGEWVEGVLPPGVKFSKEQLSAKGYNINWIKAQYRFLQALQDLVHSTPTPEWTIVVDDDTFINLDTMVKLLKRYSAKSSTSPLYVGDHGWGGAGHFFNKAAGAVLRKSLGACIEKHMIKSFKASDVTLKKCVAELGINTEWERLVSHCQANFLRERMLEGTQVSYHLKREMDLTLDPRRGLAVWRLRLYYQVVYLKNYTTAYKLLLQVGACAYGSCKNGKCDFKHDADAKRIYEINSGNGSFVPTL
eukprot:PhF_6_TR31130/c0_g1_i1/m.45571